MGAFWNEFGRVLKEGPAEDLGNRERIAGLLRFATTRSEGDAQGRLPGRLHRTHERGAGEDLLHHRRHARRPAPQSPPGDLSQERDRGAAPLGPGRRMAGLPPQRVQGQAPAVGRQGRAGPRQAGGRGGEAAKGGGRRGAWGPAQAHAGRPRRRGPGGASEHPAGRLAGLPGGGRLRHEREPGPGAQGGRAGCPGRQADPRGQPGASAGAAPGGRAG